MAPSDASAAKPTMDPVQLLVMANRIDGIVREMTNTLDLPPIVVPVVKLVRSR